MLFTVSVHCAAGIQLYSMLGTDWLANALYSANILLNDKVYQTNRALEGKIKIIAIDERSLEAIEPFNQWTRADMAQVIEILNSDPENKPSVIGVDVMYFGETEESYDDYLDKYVQKAVRSERKGVELSWHHS